MPLVALLPTLLLLACQTEPPVPDLPPITDDEVAHATADVFCRTAVQDCKADGAVATLSGHEVSFAATTRHFKILASRTIGTGSAKQAIPAEAQLEVELAVTMDGRPMVSGLITHAASDPDQEIARAKVLDEAAQRFVLGHGLGLADALAAQPGGPALAALGLAVGAQSIGEGGWVGYAGYPVLRGRGFDVKLASKMAPQVRSMVRGMAPYVAGLDPGMVHAILVQAKLGGTGSPGPCGVVPPVAMTPGASISVVPLSGTVTIDGARVPDGDKPAICALSEATAWPLPQGGAALEWTQLVVVRAEPAAPVEEPD